MRARAAATLAAASLCRRSDQSPKGLRPVGSRYSRTSTMVNGNTYGTTVKEGAVQREPARTRARRVQNDDEPERLACYVSKPMEGDPDDERTGQLERTRTENQLGCKTVAPTSSGVVFGCGAGRCETI